MRQRLVYITGKKCCNLNDKLLLLTLRNGVFLPQSELHPVQTWWRQQRHCHPPSNSREAYQYSKQASSEQNMAVRDSNWIHFEITWKKVLQLQFDWLVINIECLTVYKRFITRLRGLAITLLLCTVHITFHGMNVKATAEQTLRE